MKAWMKVLVWLGLGGGIGFFAGYQIGGRAARKDAFEEGYSSGKHDLFMETIHEACDGMAGLVEASANATKALEQYRGETGLSDIQPETEGDETLWSFTPSEEPEMPEEPPVIGDEAEIEDIPELHPQHMTQRQVTEEYFYNNPNNFDQEDLLYYEGDGTLYNKDTRKAIDKKDEIDEVLGIGMLTNFHMKGADLETIFVENPTMGMLFRIDRVEDAFGDILNGVVTEEIDEEDDTE
ncbi:MAG: hypothetical protein J6Y20_09175 [Lachnospiraceae bacterium]|nr:hypothetical protein [Lachnospiraceae bacterium]